MDVAIQVPKGTRGKDLIVDIKKKSLKVGLKGQTPIIEVLYLRAMAIPMDDWDDYPLCHNELLTLFLFNRGNSSRK